MEGILTNVILEQTFRTHDDAELIEAVDTCDPFGVPRGVIREDIAKNLDHHIDQLLCHGRTLLAVPSVTCEGSTSNLSHGLANDGAQ
jgi:hypothetical protein